MADVGAVLADLRAEGEDLDTLVRDLSDDDWARPTPAEGWTVAHQIAHLAWTDHVALQSVDDPPAFAATVAAAAGGGSTVVDDEAARGAALPAPELLAQWRSGRLGLADALARVPPDRKLDWFGPPMGATAMATARLMETWAHGQDVADALGVVRSPTARLRNVAHIGVRTRDFAYTVHRETPPAEPFRVELTAPDGSTWTWGPDDARQRVTGTASDFCLLVTQRRHRDDVDVRAEGADAEHWLTLAQAFAGPPGNGRSAGQFA